MVLCLGPILGFQVIIDDGFAMDDPVPKEIKACLAVSFGALPNAGTIQVDAIELNSAGKPLRMRIDKWLSCTWKTFASRLFRESRHIHENTFMV